MAGLQQLTVVGSAALDTIETPHGRAERILGGSVFYIGASGSLFSHVNIVGVVGDDFPFEKIEFLKQRNVSLTGLETMPGETFFWEGVYHDNMNIRDTICTELGVFEGFKPELPIEAAAARYLMLANIDPQLQLDVLDQIKDPALVAFDTMNMWISIARDKVEEVISKVDVVILNEEEIGQFTNLHNPIEGAEEILKMGPHYVVLKRGEYGAVLIGGDQAPFICPAFPLSNPIDPTGAGDTFAGAMMGYLAATDDLSAMNMRLAVVYGNITASFAVEDFGLGRLEQLSDMEIEQRFREFREMVEF
ncbi:PfkB family carbohydrate kinase [Calditrichota bacterium]